MASFEMKKMSPEEFIKNYKDSPIQRATERHANTYSKVSGHLSEHHPSHLLVAGAITERGQKFCLDGHSRRFLWNDGRLELPPGTKLDCQLWKVKDAQEACEIYLTYDSQGAGETTTNLVEGALKFLKFTPEHAPMFRETGLISAARFWLLELKHGQAKHLNYVTILRPWVTALAQLDSLDKFYQTTRFPSIVMAAAMATVRRDGNNALEFWSLFHGDAGTKSGKSMNGVEMANEVLQAYKNPMALPRSKRHRKGRQYNEFTPKLIMCYEHFMDGKRFPLLTGSGNKRWKEMKTTREWWLENFGVYDHPEIFSQQELEID